eukprot:6193796-Pleurochrysis_carterae.AAC.1
MHRRVRRGRQRWQSWRLACASEAHALFELRPRATCCRFRVSVEKLLGHLVGAEARTIVDSRSRLVQIGNLERMRKKTANMLGDKAER